MTLQHYYKVSCTGKDMGHECKFTVFASASNEASARLRGITIGYRDYPHLNHIWAVKATAVNSKRK